MIYQKHFSAVRKLISDSSLIFLISVLLLSGSLMILNGDTGGNPPAGVRYFLFAIFLIFGMLLLIASIYNLLDIRKIRNDWCIQLSTHYIKLITPNPEEDDSFEYDVKEVSKISREEYYDDGVCHKWYIYLKVNDDELKKDFDLGPFSEEKLASKINQAYDIDVYEVDAKGEKSRWHYSIGYRLRSSFSTLLGYLIFLSFLIPGFVYLANKLRNISFP